MNERIARVNAACANCVVPPVVLALLGLALWVSFRVYTGMTFEDALITFRYASNIAQGNGFVFNPGERVLGTTTPLLAVLLAAVCRLTGGHGLAIAANALMMACGVAAGLLSYAALRRIGCSALSSLLGMSVFCLSSEIMIIMAGAMETPMVLFFMALSLHSLVCRRHVLSLAACAFLILTRIDGLVWAALILAAVITRERRIPYRAVIASALILLPWFLFALLYFGSLLPHSVVAKQVIGAGDPHMAPQSIWRFLEWYGACLGSPATVLIPAWLALVAAGARRLWLALPGGVVLPLVAFPFAMGLFYWVGRAPYFDWYLVPPMWLCLLLAGVGIEEVLSAIPARFARGKARKHVLAGCLVLCLAFWGKPSLYVYQRQYQENEDQTRRALGLWLREHTSASSIVAMEAVGYQAYYSRRKIIDLAGLVSPEVVRIRRASLSNAATFRKVILQLKPDYVVLRCIEYEGNMHWHGGRLFDTPEAKSEFDRLYREAASFSAPHPAIWGPASCLSVFRRQSD